MTSTRDTLFLAITRSPCVYGVPLGGFLLGAGGCTFVFDLTTRYNIWWRLGLCGGAMLLILGTMRALTAYEPKWFSIAIAWAYTRLLVILSAHTRKYGGTTMCPLPVDLRRSRAEMKDYVG